MAYDQFSESALWDLYREAERLYKEGDYGAAEPLFRRTAQGREALLGTDHPDTLWSKFHLGRTLQFLERYSEAAKFLRESAEGRQRTLGERHSDTLWSKYWLAEAAFSQENYSEAERLYRETAEARARSLGAENPDTLWSQYHQGQALLHMRRDAEAETVLRRSLQGREKVFGAGHSHTLWNRYWLAEALFNQGKYAEAEDLYRQTAQGRASLLGDNHPDTLWSRYWLGRALKYQGRYDAAAEELRATFEGQEKALGLDHPATLWSKYWLAETLYNQGNFGKAETLFRQTLVTRERLLGREHSDTLLCKNWVDQLELLKTILGWAGNYGQARIGSLTKDTRASARVVEPEMGHRTGANERRGDGGDPPTATARGEVAFDSAELMTVGGSELAETKADEWLGLMGRVNEFFSLYRREPLTSDEMVNVLLIDSGIDLTHPVFRKLDPHGQRISQRFCRDFVNGERRPMTDSTGHGTHCAHTILKICSAARLYVAKVFDSNVGDEHTVGRIVEAIRWGQALDNHGVDMVCMAFAFSHPHPALADAIRRARGQRNVLFFAAASNNKYFSEDPVGFPAKMDEVIRVNSCSHSGKRSSFSPRGSERRGDNLGTIGEEMPAADAGAGTGGRGRGERRMSGTSMATAVMTGVAALVVEFSRLAPAPEIYPDRPREQVTTELLTNDGMKAVLHRCLAGVNPPAPPTYCYIRPWLLFDVNNQDVMASRIRDALTVLGV